MTRCFSLIALLLFSVAYAQDERPNSFPTSSLAGFSLPSTLVNNSVCVISGELIDIQTDIALDGPEPLTLRRFYSNFSGSTDDLIQDDWKFNHGVYAHIGKSRPFVGVLMKGRNITLMLRRALGLL